ncbi:MAG: 30S ribosome-binding factor RbfA [Phycisphaeraceae bacterium]|nr:30S ribosome-binding factor RbfA [Phycisphaeraceae bacterium]
MSHRLEQVESVVKRALGEAITGRLADPRVDGMISITRVQVSADLREATVFVTVLPREAESRNIHGLNHAAGHLGSLIAHRFASRRVPRLRFKLDQVVRKQTEVLSAISQALEEDKKRKPENPTDADPPDGEGTSIPKEDQT